MLEGLKPYPAYRESGVPWLGRVPEHWGLSRGKGLFEEAAAPVRDSDEIVTCFRDGQVTLRRNRRATGFMVALKEAGYQGVRKGQLVIHAMDAFAGAVGVSENDGKCTPEYIVCNATDAGTRPAYYASALRVAARSGFIEVACSAVRERAPRLRYPDFGALVLPVPSPEEQAAIVRLLDQAERRIRRFIHGKKKLIEFIEEQKRAAIQLAVTRGLDPNIHLKHSGIAWLRDVPEHWNVISLRHRYSQCLGKMLDTKRIRGENLMPYLRNTDVQWDRINTENLPTMDIAPEEHGRYTVRIGDLLVCEGGEVGRCAIWSGPSEGFGFQKALHRLRPLKPDLDEPRYLFYVLKTAATAKAFDDGQESTIGHLTGDKLRAHRFPFPPIAEQQHIAALLDSLTSDLGALQASAQREIAIAHELRSRLVTDVVTGKLDVREAAARLPEETIAPDETGYDEVDTPVEDDADNEPDADSAGSEA